MQYQVVTLSVVSLESASENIPDTLKENWWVDRYAWLWWVSITVFGTHFRDCLYSFRFLSVLVEQNNFKYQWIAIWNICKKNASWDQLQPTLKVLIFHLRRVNYQTFIWNSACVPVLDLPSPIGNGLQKKGLQFCEKFILNLSVPDAIVELMRAVKQIYLLANVQI